MLYYPYETITKTKDHKYDNNSVKNSYSSYDKSSIPESNLYDYRQESNETVRKGNAYFSQDNNVVQKKSFYTAQPNDGRCFDVYTRKSIIRNRDKSFPMRWFALGVMLLTFVTVAFLGKDKSKDKHENSSKYSKYAKASIGLNVLELNANVMNSMHRHRR